MAAELNYSLVNTDGGQELAAGIQGLDAARKAAARHAANIGQDVEIVAPNGRTVERVGAGTPTSHQIETLYRKAAATGDAETCMLCDVASGVELDWAIESFLPVTKQEACARILAIIRDAGGHTDGR
jgi:hypothetical protein